MALPYAGAVAGQGQGILGSRFAYGNLGKGFTSQAGVAILKQLEIN